MSRRNGYDESKLRPNQREAALALVEYSFGSGKTKQQIADELNISRQALHRWDTQDQNFIAYKNHLSATFMNSHLSFVYGKMLEGIDNGSMKGIELYLRRYGDLDRRDELTVNQGAGSDDQSFDERREALLKRLQDDKED